jgi:hypothetical protein
MLATFAMKEIYYGEGKEIFDLMLQIRRCAAGGIMVLSVLPVPAVLATRSFHVQTFTVL